MIDNSDNKDNIGDTAAAEIVLPLHNINELCSWLVAAENVTLLLRWSTLPGNI